MRDEIGAMLLNASVMALAGAVLMAGAIVLLGKAAWFYLQSANWRGR